jgi:hypothetical protein
MALLLSNKPKLDPKKPNKSHTPNDIYKDQSFEPAKRRPPLPQQQPKTKKKKNTTDDTNSSQNIKTKFFSMSLFFQNELKKKTPTD